ncbi:unnamed protein product [Chilo suppressalis]|uniref:Seminal fluid protein n=1 Tax=Chilo suppressalis TaxID=168631 RepID=A0ABN8B8V7_CHISP|nr:unnamed protein product [Chilo suppressalis]
MICAVFIFSFTTFVNAEIRSLQHDAFMSRKSRSSSPPIHSGYYYSKVDDHPGTLAMYGNDVSDYNLYSLTNSGSFPTNAQTKYDPIPLDINLGSNSIEAHAGETPPYYNADKISSYNYDYEKSKSEADYDAHYYPSKMKSDAMYEKLKSIMHYKYPEAMGDINYYDFQNDYHIDDDDVRSSSRTSYDGWPYYYHSPYEYETKKMDADVEKAKDKRYVAGVIKDHIPVHEQVDDIPVDYSATPATNRFHRAMSTDNPIYGNKPFFSYVLNDYFDKNSDDDPLSFKGMEWGKEFDHGASPPGQKRDRRLESHYTPADAGYFKGNTNNDLTSSKVAVADSSTEKGYDKKHEYDKHKKGDEQQEQHKSAYEKNGNNYNGFKNFVDSFANKFGGEEEKKDSQYSLSQSQDKGENRKGFRRVYHKDEYQEDNEFFDNRRNKAKAEEKGSSALHNGGSNAILQSQAAASLGNEANAFSNSGNNDKKKFDNHHKGHDNSKGYDSKFNKYIDVAKMAAKSNSADYVNH